MPSEFTHLNAHGHAAMVDVTHKDFTHRHAEARCTVTGAIAELLERDNYAVLQRALHAGLMGAKSTSSLIPLCHPLPLVDIDVTFELGLNAVTVRAQTETVSQTGVEMEALTACTAAALTLLAEAMVTDPLARMDDLSVWEKHGGKSGEWRRDAYGVMRHRNAEKEES